LFRFFKELSFKVIVWAALFPNQNTITNREQPVSRREEERADGENGTLTYSFKPRDTIARERGRYNRAGAGVPVFQRIVF